MILGKLRFLGPDLAFQTPEALLGRGEKATPQLPLSWCLSLVRTSFMKWRIKTTPKNEFHQILALPMNCHQKSASLEWLRTAYRTKIEQNLPFRAQKQNKKTKNKKNCPKTKPKTKNKNHRTTGCLLPKKPACQLRWYTGAHHPKRPPDAAWTSKPSATFRTGYNQGVFKWGFIGFLLGFGYCFDDFYKGLDGFYWIYTRVWIMG